MVPHQLAAKGIQHVAQSESVGKLSLGVKQCAHAFDHPVHRFTLLIETPGQRLFRINGADEACLRECTDIPQELPP